MNTPLIWIHEQSLRITHPVFSHAPIGTKAVFIWDDHYFHQLNYSLKRLVFIYETLCEMPVQIIHGDTVTIIRDMMPSALYVAASNKPSIISLFNELQKIASVQIIADEDFVLIEKSNDFKRFFPYWNLASKTALKNNGGIDA